MSFLIRDDEVLEKYNGKKIGKKLKIVSKKSLIVNQCKIKVSKI